MKRTAAVVAVVAWGSLACGGPTGEPIETDVGAVAPGGETVEPPASPSKAGKRKGGNTGTCESGTAACSDDSLMFCEQGAFQAVENCQDRGDFWGCVELPEGGAECRALNGM